MTDRKKPGWTFWTAVAIAFPVLYVASSGPMEWLNSRGYLPAWSHPPVFAFYRPITWMAVDGPAPVSKAIIWYVMLWHRPQEFPEPPIPIRSI
ncbi:MAG TPA: hypothetical protein VGM05_33255 [Planctomycetaceae bacterium]|jgi:hypothetical protein